MSEIHRVPVVSKNLQLLPKDFVRLGEFAEDLVSRLAEHVLLDPDDAAMSRGVVLWGLGVTDVTPAGGPPTVRVAAGAALVPSSAGDRRWNLALHLSPSTTALVDSGATDTVQLELVDQDDGAENRDVRVIGPGGSSVQNQVVNTFRKPVGSVTVREGVNESAAGAVWLAAVTKDGAGAVSAIDTMTKRYALWALDAGVPGNGVQGQDGYQHRGLRSVVRHLFDRVGSVIDVLGSLKSTISVGAGGDDITFTGAGMNLGGRNLTTTGNVTAGVVIGSSGVRGAGVRPVREAVEDTPTVADYTASADGLKAFGGLLPRARALVHVYFDGGFDRGEWIGDNITSVTRIGEGHYRIRFAVAAFDTAFGGLASGRWAVRVSPTHAPIDGLAADANHVTFNCLRPAGGVGPSNDTDVDVHVQHVYSDGGAQIGLADRSFFVELLGPIGAANYNGGDPDPGQDPAGASWTAVA